MLIRFDMGEGPRWGWMGGGRTVELADSAVAAVLAGQGRLAELSEVDGPPIATESVQLLAPMLPGQEVWAAGVTYESSKLARMSESEAAGDFYARVYTADRPELFLKATADRVVGPGGQVRVRADSVWSVPEPELAVLLSARGEIIGYSLGNDMSARDIEGANPLYLPQAKVYRGCCALGPWVVPAESVDPRGIEIGLTILRNRDEAFVGQTSTLRMRRGVEDLAAWLFRENEFPAGVWLLTGTGIVPPDNFTLLPGDEVVIQGDGIGTLRNTVG